MNLPKTNCLFLKLVLCKLFFLVLIQNNIHAQCSSISIYAPSNSGSIVVSGHASAADIAEIIIFDEYWATVTSCNSTCAQEDAKTFSNLPSGVYNVKVILYDVVNNNWVWKCDKIESETVTTGSGCPTINVNTSVGQLTVTGYTQSSPTSHVKVFDSSWNLKGECWGTGCPSSSFTVTGLSSGNHHVIVDYYSPNTCSSYSGTHSVPAARISSNTEATLTEVEVSNKLPSSTVEDQPMELSKLMPNPVRDFLTVEIKSSAETNQLLRIYNMQGALVLQQPLQLFRGVNRVELNIADLPKGVYVLMPFGNVTQSNRTRFVKI